MSLDLASVAVSGMFALAGGAAGGTLLAGPAARRSERARRRDKAEIVLCGTLSTYRDTLVYERNQVTQAGSYPPGYGSVERQEWLATIVLRHVPILSGRTGRKLRTELVTLVGTVTVNFVASRLYVAADTINFEAEQNRLAFELRKVLKIDGHAEINGQVNPLLKLQNDSARLEAAHVAVIETLQRMLALVGE